MKKRQIYYFDKNIEKELERVQSLEEPNKSLILAFRNHLEAQGVVPERVMKLSSQMRRISRDFETSLSAVTKEDLVKIKALYNTKLTYGKQGRPKKDGTPSKTPELTRRIILTGLDILEQVFSEELCPNRLERSS